MNDPPLLDRISDYVSWYAARTPDAEAMSLAGAAVSYRELASRVDRMSSALLAAGVERGDRVATLAGPHPDFLVVMLASASIGAIWIGLNPRYQHEELAYVLRDSEPKVVLAQRWIAERDYVQDLFALRDALNVEHWVVLSDQPTGGGLMPVAEFLDHGARIEEQVLAHARSLVRPEDPALIVYTSGSTGQPKGALLPHRGLVRCSVVQYRHWRPQPLRALNFFPINHVGCVGDICCYCLVAGGCVVFLEKFAPHAVIEHLRSERITIWGGVPTTFLLTLPHPSFAQADLSSVQMIVWSGAAAPAEMVEKLATTGARLGTSYGLTETVGSVTYTPEGATVDVLANTIGSAPDDYELRIVSTDGVEAQDGSPGEIQVRGDFLMRGYWRRPEATAEIFDAEGWMRTGDIGIRGADGFIRLRGRLKEIFKSGGYNVYPREIEQILERHPAVALAAVVAAPDRIYGEVGHAFVVPADREPAPAELQEHCRALLANYKVPKRFTVMTDPPMLPVGKIDKRRLRELAIAAGA